MSSTYQRHPEDTVTVHRSVLQSIVRAAALSVEGVSRLGNSNRKLERWLGTRDGVQLLFDDDDNLTVNVELVVDAHYKLYPISLKVQHEVVRTIREYVGLDVQSVNVYIADVVFGAE
jgi:uncharacterized alkaline shock family protein YloU